VEVAARDIEEKVELIARSATFKVS